MIIGRIILLVLMSFFLCASLSFPPPCPARQQLAGVELIHPIDNAEIVSKKLTITGRFLAPVYPESMLLILDGIDLTGIAVAEADGFSCELIDTLPAGEHSIYVAVQGEEELYEQQIFFTSRHYEHFDEFYSYNDLSMTVGAALNRSPPLQSTGSGSGYLGNISPLGNVSTTPYAKIDAYLTDETILRKDGFNFTFSGNLRYLNQNDPVSDPEKIGFDLLNLNLKADYQKTNAGVFSEFGDLQLSQSANTIQNLARRGGQLSLQYRNTFINGFSVLNRETFSFDEDVGIGFNANENVMGVSGGFTMLDDKVGFKALYINGSDQFNSYNAWAQGTSDPYAENAFIFSPEENQAVYLPAYQAQQGSGKGDVVGFVLTSNFFSDRLYTEFEYDESAYDSDDADEFPADDDQAWRLLFGGAYDIYTYDLVYEYYGPFYTVPGARGLRTDYEGVTATGYMDQENHVLNATLSGYRDNVEDDPYYSRINSFYGTLGYRYYGLEAFVLGFDYSRGVDRSSDEPEDDVERQLDTDVLGLNLNYARGAFGIDLYGQYSRQDDRTEGDFDTSITTLTLSPSYTLETFSAFSTFSLNQSKDHTSDIRTDTYTISLDLLGSFYRQQFTYELGGSYDQTRSTDDLIDTNGVTGYCRLAYHLPQSFWSGLNASIALEGNYNDRDQGGDQFGAIASDDIHSVVLSFSATLPYAL